MESDDEERKESYLNVQKTRKSKANNGNTLVGKMEELVKTEEELKRAKDDTIQTWLDSKLFIDELERLNSDLASARNRSSMCDVIISELVSELETTNESIRSKKEEEQKAKRTISKISPELDQTRQDLEILKRVTDEEMIARSKLKQVLRIRKQRLQTLQLTLGAIGVESAAFGSSTAEALRLIGISESDNTTVQLTNEEYSALTTRAVEETSLTKWRISVSVEQKQTAEASQEMALSRLKESYSYNRSKRRMREEKMAGDQHTRAEEQGSAFPKDQAKLNAEPRRKTPQHMTRSVNNNQRKLMKKKNTSIFHHICSCFSS